MISPRIHCNLQSSIARKVTVAKSLVVTYCVMKATLMIKSLNILFGYRRLLIIITLTMLLSLFVSLLYLEWSWHINDNQFNRRIHSEDSFGVYSFKQIHRSKSLSRKLYAFSGTTFPIQINANIYI